MLQSVDWVWSSITFPTKSIENSVSEPKTSMQASTSEEMELQPNSNNYDNSNLNTTEKTTPTSAPKINISSVNAATHSKVHDSPGTQEFCLHLISNDISACASSISDSPLVDMSNIPEEYHDFVEQLLTLAQSGQNSPIGHGRWSYGMMPQNCRAQS